MAESAESELSSPQLLQVIGQYMMLARVMATVEMELDEPAGTAVLDSSDRRG